jgi:hypothetical protein
MCECPPVAKHRDGSAVLTVIGHDSDCDVLCERVRRRWWPETDRLPETPPPVPFAQTRKWSRTPRARPAVA